MALIKTEDSSGGSVKRGIVAVNSRNGYINKNGKDIDDFAIFAGPYNAANDSRPRSASTPGDILPYNSLINNDDFALWDFAIGDSRNPDHVIMIGDPAINRFARGISLIFQASNPFTVTLSKDSHSINGGIGTVDGIKVPQGSRIELFQITGGQWTAELIDTLGVRTTPVPTALVPL